jgi:hypothetical protein
MAIVVYRSIWTALPPNHGSVSAGRSVGASPRVVGQNCVADPATTPQQKQLRDGNGTRLLTRERLREGSTISTSEDLSVDPIGRTRGWKLSFADGSSRSADHQDQVPVAVEAAEALLGSADP